MTTSAFVLAFFLSPLNTFAWNAWENYSALNGGVYNEEYYIDVDTYNTRGYSTITGWAFNEWNSSVQYSRGYPADVEFSRSSDRSGTVIDIFVAEYGNTGWNGRTLFYTYSGGQVSPSGTGPDQDYDWTRIQLNDTYLNNDGQTPFEATIQHEIGHALGLAHSGTKYAIMYRNRDRYVDDVSYDDITGVNTLY